MATGADRRSAQTYQFDTPAVCIPLVSSTGHGKKTLNYVHYQEGKFAVGTILAAVIPKDKKVLDARYLYTYLQMNKDRVLVPLMRGAANVSLSVSAISDVNIPVPPLSEQKKALSKLDCMSGEHAELLQETDKQLELLKQLRQQILQDAIEGKLTADWRKKNPALITGENHASKLLEKIKSEKSRQIQQGKLKKEKPLPPITEAEKPFPLPERWALCRLQDCSINKDGERQPVSQKEREGKEKTYPYYGASGVIDKINGFTHEGLNLLIAEDGANLVSRSTPIAFIANGRYWVNNHAHILGFLNENTLNYFQIHLNAIDLTPYITGGFQPKLSQGNLNIISISLPPLTEQKAIVNQVSKLTTSIDELQKQILERKDQSEMLMQSVLREAFEK